MLNEKIEKFNEIADSKGLFFVWQSIGLGVTSITSLVQHCYYWRRWDI